MMIRKAAASEFAQADSDEIAFNELFRTPVVCIPSEDVGAWADFLGPELPILALDDHLLGELSAASHSRRFSSAPPCIVAMLATSAAQMPLLHRARASFLALNGSMVPPPRLVTATEPAGIVGALASGLSQTLMEQANLISTQARELAKIRKENEQLQNQFHSLERFLDRRGDQPCDAVFTSVPALGTAGEGRLKLSYGFKFGQVLPVASQGICGFALYVETPGDRDCKFAINLQSLEDGQTLGNWSIQADQLRAGWNTFALNKAVSGLRRSVRLEFFVSEEGKPPTLMLGEIQPLLRFQVSELATNQPFANRNLSLRVYAGLPGVIVPDWFASPKVEQSGVREINMRGDRLSAVRQTAFNAPVSYKEVMYLADERSLLCHPPKQGTTVAELSGIVPIGTVRVTATGFLDHDQGKLVELSLRAVVPHGNSERQLIAESGWVVVQPQQSVILNAFFSRPIPANANIEFASRMREQGNNDFGWAKFRDIYFAQMVEAV